MQTSLVDNVNLKTFLENRLAIANQAPRFFERCRQCLRPKPSCYCPHIQSFDPKMTFVILTDPLEFRRRIASGRMAHLCLQNSFYQVGRNFSENTVVNALLNDKANHSIILYPAPGATALHTISAPERATLFPPEKRLVVFLLDGTWNTAAKMYRQSRNLSPLPKYFFTPPRASNFRIRKQPKAECVSTLEAIHHTIELLGPGRHFNLSSGEHHRLLHVFDRVVEEQLVHVKKSYDEKRPSRHRLNGFKAPH